MSKKFILQTEGGKLDSLREQVKVAFTITPVVSGTPSHPYSPLAMFTTEFPINTSQSVTAEWFPKITFATYQRSGRLPLMRYSWAKTLNSPGQAVTLTSRAAWSNPTPSHEPTSYLAINQSGATADIALYLGPLVLAYSPLSHGNTIKFPSNWELQAYLVAGEIVDRTILEPKDLSRPIFTSPISCDVLPSESTWRLFQDLQGTIKVTNDKYPGLGSIPTTSNKPVESPKESNQLSEVLERLGVMEKSITSMQEDFAQGQRDIAEIRDQFRSSKEEVLQECRRATSSQLSDFNRNIEAVEVKTATLRESFIQTQDRLCLVHKAISETQHVLSGMEQSTSEIKIRLPLVESKAEAAIASIASSHDRLKSHVAAVEKTIHQTQDHVSVVQQLVLAKQVSSAAIPAPPLPEQPIDLDRRVLAIEARLDKLERLTQEQRKIIRGVDRRILAADKLETDVGGVQVSLAMLERRVSAIEARSGDDEGGSDVSPSPVVGGSPVMFPNHPADDPSPF